MNYIEVFLDAFLDVFLDMSLYMLIGMVLTGVLSVVMKKQMVAKHLGKNARVPAVKAAAFGVPLPLCSCGVLPTTVYLSQNGASTSAVMSFLISTPQTGVDSIIATFGMMGVVFAVYRPVVAFISGVVGGSLIQKIAGNKRIEDSQEALDAECEEFGNCCDENSCEIGQGANAAVEPKLSLSEKLKKMFNYAFVEFVDDIALHFVVGVIIAALITIIIPTGFFESLNISSGILAMLVMLVIGLPMYICSTSSIPIALVLMAKGISPGAAFVFLFAGPATNAASLAVLAKSLGKKTVAVYLAITAVSAIGFGLLLDGLIGWFSLPMPDILSDTMAHGTNWLQIVTGVIFGGVLIRSLVMRVVRKIRAKRDKAKENVMELSIEGMSCEHCAKRVTQALENIGGVVSVSVDVKEGKAYVQGEDIDMAAMKQAVEDAGYDVK
ncbi:MAG: SO_0444 family Cu/Zn efflux transporter [Clostridia bacterium]|jgi:uncharacterized protein|nr:SO_0444 family Cu/Zn efflux transporter [Clostridia bacterium]MBT7122503.1 SO_0444 family Cu/Zn efflux transporter [Clostridia bacterium]